MLRYIINVLIAFDRMLNAILNGNPAETLSSVSFRKHRDNQFWGFLCPVINGIFFNKNHCATAYLDDRHTVLPA